MCGSSNLGEADVVRFSKKVRIIIDETSCWDWTGAYYRGGYGMFRIGKQLHPAHRVSWRIHAGAIPLGAFVCHKCDRRSCVRPDHLFLGSRQDNTEDAKAKGRYAHGDQHAKRQRSYRAKLTREQVLAVRESKERPASLAARFGVHPDTIRNIKNGRTWRGVQ